MGHEEPFVGPCFIPLQQDGPKDPQLGHEWVSRGLAQEEPNGAEGSPSKRGDEGRRNTRRKEEPNPPSVFPILSRAHFSSPDPYNLGADTFFLAELNKTF